MYTYKKFSSKFWNRRSHAWEFLDSSCIGSSDAFLSSVQLRFTINFSSLSAANKVKENSLHCITIPAWKVRSDWASFFLFFLRVFFLIPKITSLYLVWKLFPSKCNSQGRNNIFLGNILTCRNFADVRWFWSVPRTEVSVAEDAMRGASLLPPASLAWHEAQEALQPSERQRQKALPPDKEVTTSKNTDHYWNRNEYNFNYSKLFNFLSLTK